MDKRQVAPYGSWKSPITTDMVVARSVRLQQIVVDGTDIYWNESRPAEAGRYVIVRWPEADAARPGDVLPLDVTPPPFNARTTVHEYGGGDFIVVGGQVYFSNFADQRVYHQSANGDPVPLTAEGDVRYADYAFDARQRRLICVREDHRDPSGQGTLPPGQVVNTIAAISLDDGTVHELVSGSDFYATPRLSPDGKRLAWLSWNHPNMPWDETELWVGDFGGDGQIVTARHIAGGCGESIFQPEWSPDGVLHFVSDRTGWWNLYRWQNEQVEPLSQMEAEFGLPLWVFHQSTYTFESPDSIICCYAQNGVWHLARLDTSHSRLETIPVPYTFITSPKMCGRSVVFKAGSPTESLAIVKLNLRDGKLETLRRSDETAIAAEYFSAPETIEFPTENGQTAHAFFYPPHNPDFRAPDGELPPLLVISHGGPTSATHAVLSLNTQFWTSRGFGVLDVNYGGSTGYGRAYRERLRGQWGIVDVDDCANGALYLVQQGRVDGNRLAIRGGSAGGYTTLCALTFRQVFKTGASYFGVSDAEALAKETHKFESHYLDGLIGPYPARRDLYIERSPIHFTERLSCPLILFQGLEDKIVPPDQAELMYEAVRSKGLPTAYVAFEGEQHGFRRAETIKRALEAELYFYSKIFGFELSEPVEPVPIDNLR